MASVSSYDEKRWRLSFFDKSKSPKRKAKYLKKKSYYKTYGYTKKQAEQEAFRLEQLHKQGEIDLWKSNFDSKSLTISEAIEVWKKKASKRLAESTIKNRLYGLKKFQSEFGNSYIDNIDQSKVEDYVNNYTSVQARKSAYTYINDLFKVNGLALDVSIISTKKERLKKRSLSNKEWITTTELTTILNGVDSFNKHKARNKHASLYDYSYMKDIVQLAYYTGMRRGELFACKVGWVYEDFKKIKIGDEDFTPKSQQKFEIMPTIKEARPILKRLCEGKKSSDYIFNLDPSRASKNFKSIVRYLLPEKAEHLKFHSLRHSFVMYCLYVLKLPEHIVMQLTRHKDRRSLQIYMHEDIKSVIELLDSL